MDKQDFLLELRARLRAIPEEDTQASIDYYAEMIDDRMEDGLSEEEAVAAIGSVDEIARNIIADAPIAQLVSQKVEHSRRLRWWEIALLVLGSPVWLSLVLTAAAVAFCVYVSLWSVVISLYATAIGLGTSAIGCILGSFFMIADGIRVVLVVWGAALVCAGLAILFFMLSNLAAKGMVALTKLTWKGIKHGFAGKERTA